MELDDVEIEARAVADVEQLIRELEPQLTADQRRLLHRLRLAAEALGAIRVARPWQAVSSPTCLAPQPEP